MSTIITADEHHQPTTSHQPSSHTHTGDGGVSEQHHHTTGQETIGQDENGAHHQHDHQTHTTNGLVGNHPQQQVIHIQEQQQHQLIHQSAPVSPGLPPNGTHFTRPSMSQSSNRGSMNGSPNRKQGGGNGAAVVMDELTEYAMAKEGIDPEDLVPRPYEEFLKESNGNHKLAQLRYEYKEAERQALMQDIENRKKIIQLEIANENHYNTLSSLQQQNDSRFATKDHFYQTQQPTGLLSSKMSRTSQSQAHLPTTTFHSLKAAKKPLDNKIFENMLRNQVENEHKLRTIQERQEVFLAKSQQLAEKRAREIARKQEMMVQKQALKEEKLRRQEEQQRQWQQETLYKLKMKGELTEQRQEKYKQELRQKMHEKEQKKEQKKLHAQEQYNKYVEELQERQKGVQVKTQVFQRKLEERARLQREAIKAKQAKNEQVLHTVQEMRDLEEQKKTQLYMQAQFLEMEKERRLEEDKRKQTEFRMRKGQQKSDKITFKVEEAYKKMSDWQQELERREQAAADNLKKQQKILAEQQQLKSEMKRLKQESAQLKQKRKEAKEKLKKDEQLDKLQGMFQKMDSYKQNQVLTKQKKQQEIFKAEQKRADMKTAFYHMAVWNVQEAGDLIKEILEENDKGNGHGVKPKSVAEKVREKAAKLRRDERLGYSRVSPKNYESGGGGLNFISEEVEEQQQQQIEEQQQERAQSHQQQFRQHHQAQRANGNHLENQQVVYDARQHE